MSPPPPPGVLVLTGPPGAGKTTIAGLLAGSHERAVHLESDRFFDFIRSGRIDPWRPESHAQNVAVMEVVARAAAGYAEAGYFTIIDGILIPGWFLEPVREMLDAAGHPGALVVLQPSLAVCLERSAGRASRRLADPAVVEKLWRQFDGLGPLEANVIDSGATGPRETADAISRQFGTGPALS